MLLRPLGIQPSTPFPPAKRYELVEGITSCKEEVVTCSKADNDVVADIHARRTFIGFGSCPFAFQALIPAMRSCSNHYSQHLCKIASLLCLLLGMYPYYATKFEVVYKVFDSVLTALLFVSPSNCFTDSGKI